MKLFKIWNAKGKKCVMANSLTDVLTKGSEKFGADIRYIYLSDGTEIDETDVLMSLETGTILHLETYPGGPVTCTSQPSVTTPNKGVFCPIETISIKKENSISSESSGDSVIIDLDESPSTLPVPSGKHQMKRMLSQSLECLPSGSSSNEIESDSDNSSKRMKLPLPLQLPENIPTDVVKILKDKPFDPLFYQARVKLVKKAREFFSGFCPYPSTTEYEMIVNFLGNEFPHLSDPGVKDIDPPRKKYASLLIQLQQAFRNSRRKSTPPTKQCKPRDFASVQQRSPTNTEPKYSSVDDIAYARMVKEIKSQLQAAKVNDNVVGKLLQESFQLRRKWICDEEVMTIKRICEEFPALIFPKWVLHECSMVSDLNVEKEVQSNLDLYFYPVVQALGCAEEYDANNEDISTIDNDKLCRVFELVQHKLCSKKDVIMHEYEVGCNLKVLFEKKGNEPVLIIIKDTNKKVQQIFIGAEKRELFEVENASITRALALLVSSYYVYNVAYQRGKYFLLFLQEFLVGIPDRHATKNSRYATFSKQVKSYTEESLQ